MTTFYSHQKLEKKWQNKWAKFSMGFKPHVKKEKKYILDMFPYPSGEGLHVGHVESYTATDIISRFLRMKGNNVLHPQGFDAFGLPAENYAISTGIHPAETTKKAIANFKKQINAIGLSYDWSREVVTSDPSYYKWTQWLFLQLLKKSLAYKKKAPVNWCKACKTVLANEQVVNGRCERCESTVIQKDLEQWFFKITDYAGELLAKIDEMDWPEPLKHAQKNWIGKSEGALIKFPITNNQVTKSNQSPKSNYQNSIEIFTTRPDTLFGATYLVLAPEHPLIEDLRSKIENWNEVGKYINQSKKKNQLERTDLAKEKTGVELKGIKAINPANKKEITVWVADYVMTGYGAGAIMAVPAHDERDWEFAKKYNLEIKPVIRWSTWPIIVGKPFDIGEKTFTKAFEDMKPYIDESDKIKKGEKIYTGEGVLINSDEFNGLTSEVARDKITKFVNGKKQTQYKIRDWLISRQRYWGAPIPVIYCDKCSKEKEQVLILHGWEDNSNSGFIPALKKDLENKGYEVFAFDAPNTNEPDFDDWFSFIEKKIKENKLKDFHLVGHSMGGHLSMKLAEKHKIKKLVLVAPVGFSSSADYFSQFKGKLTDEELDIFKNFQSRKLNIDLVKKNVGRISFIFGAKDSWITKEIVEFYSTRFNESDIQILANQKHMCESEGVKQLKELESKFGKLELEPIPVPEKDLPVLLPTDVDFKPTGESPLVRSKQFHQVKCPKCGQKARRESDTMDTFVCSSWYFLRYCDPQNNKEPFSKESVKKWLPVDLYIGGMEHAVGHLIYARFITKVLRDLGWLKFDEPFLKIRNQGIILAEDSRKMSKRWGNVINPDEVVEEYGADTLRIYEMFMGPLEDAKPWSQKGIIGVRRFLEKIYKIFSSSLPAGRHGKFQTPRYKKITNSLPAGRHGKLQIPNLELLRLLHKTIKKVTEDIENIKFNTAISSMMIFINEVAVNQEQVTREIIEKLLIIISPFAPHLAEELWESLGHKQSIFLEKWPTYDKKLVIDEEVTIAIQVNGKLRETVKVERGINEEELRSKIQELPRIKKYTAGKEIKKFIYIKDKLVNLVV